MRAAKAKQPRVKWATHFYLTKSSRGYVEAGVRGTAISVLIGLEDAERQRSKGESYERTCQPDSIWAKAMERIAAIAEDLVQRGWTDWKPRIACRSITISDEAGALIGTATLPAITWIVLGR